MARSAAEFSRDLTTLGWFSPEEVERCATTIAEPRSAEKLAEAFMATGRLTRFQADELLAGRGRHLILGDYRLEERLGLGGMGEVFRARHVKMDRLVAVKVLAPQAARFPENVARFQREVQASGRLHHPNIVVAHDASEHDGTHFLVLEFVDGVDLSRWLKQHGPMSIDQALDVALQAARGLEHAHGEGIVHRDIKPGNLLLDPRGVVKILDMGAARIDNLWGEPPSDDDDDDGLTHTGNLLGTIDYMAPEQALNLRTADARSDIYGLGCTLFRLLTGAKLYRGETVLEKLLAHREAPIPRARSLRPDVPEGLDSILTRMVAKRPEDRYASMSDVIHDLEALRDTIGADAPHWPLDAGRGSTAAAIAQAVEERNTQWSQSPAGVALAAEPADAPWSQEGAMGDEAEAEPSTSEVPLPSRAPLTNDTPNWGMPALAGLGVALVLIIMLALPGSSPSPRSPAPSTAPHPILKEERFAQDPPLTERAIERMRREIEATSQAWQETRRRDQEAVLKQLEAVRREGDTLLTAPPALPPLDPAEKQ